MNMDHGAMDHGNMEHGDMAMDQGITPQRRI